MKSYKIWTTLFVLLLALPAMAANEATSGWDWAIENIVLIMASATLVGTLFSLLKATKTIWLGQTIQKHELAGMSHEAAVGRAKQESFWGYIYQQLDGGVTLDKEADVMLNHDYDGIRELDNNLPPWWVGMFYATIVFGFLYIGVIHFSDFGKTQVEEYEAAIIESDIAIAAFMATQKKAVTAETAVAVVSPERMAAGAELYTTYCLACHGVYGEGTVGPNMTDDYWIHGGGIKNVFATVSNGVVEKGMIPWKTQLSPSEIQDVSSYILTLRGTNPPNPKAPEGELYVEGGTSATPQAGEEEVGTN